MTGPERDKLIEDNLQLVWYVMAHYYPSTINSPEREDFCNWVKTLPYSELITMTKKELLESIKEE